MFLCEVLTAGFCSYTCEQPLALLLLLSGVLWILSGAMSYYAVSEGWSESVMTNNDQLSRMAYVVSAVSVLMLLWGNMSILLTTTCEVELYWRARIYVLCLNMGTLVAMLCFSRPWAQHMLGISHSKVLYEVFIRNSGFAWQGD